jgi:hypothetical protein
MRILEVTRRETAMLFRLFDPESQGGVQDFAGAITHQDATVAEYLLWPDEAATFRSKLGADARWQELALAARDGNTGSAASEACPRPSAGRNSRRG